MSPINFEKLQQEKKNGHRLRITGRSKTNYTNCTSVDNQSRARNIRGLFTRVRMCPWAGVVSNVLETGLVTLTGTGQELITNEQVRAAYLGM